MLAAVLGAGRPSRAQEISVTRTAGSPAAPHPDGALPPDPPVLVASPDVAVTQGAVTATTRGKLVVTREGLLSENVRSSLHGSVAFAFPGGMRHDSEAAFRAGSVQWEMSRGPGCRAELRLAGDLPSQTLHGRVETPLAGGVHADATGDIRWTRTEWGQERVGYGQVVFRRQLWRGLVVQPGMHAVEVRARDTFGWFGATLRLECRGAELFVNHEGERGSRLTTRKVWRLGTARFQLGGQVKLHPKDADHGLVEVGVGGQSLGLRLFEGDAQRAILFQAGPVQIGFSQSPDLRQGVLGYENLSLSFGERASGATEVALGFVFRGVLRNVARTPAGIRWQPPLPQGAIEEPHLRWPGLASLLY